MKSEIIKQLSETVDELERYELYLSNSVDEDTIHFNRVKIQKLKVKVREQVESLLLIKKNVKY
tara:strand:- start:3313 stop:3501 length:189 start_codon:yes stop_codon:yes gene_type:complete